MTDIERTGFDFIQTRPEDRGDLEPLMQQGAVKRIATTKIGNDARGIYWNIQRSIETSNTMRAGAEHCQEWAISRKRTYDSESSTGERDERKTRTSFKPNVTNGTESV
jgi:hypothetical protein